jgi:sugar phosphate isomerase/epimerase
MKLSRRHWLATSGAAVAGSLLIPKGLQAMAVLPGKKAGVGIQLYTVRDHMNKDAEGTLRQVAAIGYKNVEHAGYWKGKFYGRTPVEFRKLLEGLGLNLVSGHVSIGPDHWDDARQQFTDEWKNTVEAAVLAGQRYLVTPSMDESWRKDYDTLLHYLDVFNRFGAYCKQHGIKFGYHSHNMEFDIFFHQQRIYDLILQHTDPALVAQEMDIGNMYAAGGRPLQLFKQYPGRFELLHLRDEIKSPGTGERDQGYDSTVLGRGVLPVAEIISAAAKRGGTVQFIVEQESFQGLDSLDCAREDFQFLQKCGLV